MKQLWQTVAEVVLGLRDLPIVCVNTDGLLISQKVFIKSFCNSRFPHKSVNLSFIITNIKNKLTDVCGD